MKKLVSGGIGLSILCLMVAIVYVQARTVDANSIANYSQDILNSSISSTKLIDKVNDPAVKASVETAAVNIDPVADDKELVKKTGSVKTAKVGRGAFSATAYCLKGRTAMGHSVRRGIIAADPRVLKLGSRVYVSAGQWSGTYLVSDTGSAIKGKKIDIWVPGCGEARRFGRRTVQVFSAQ